MIRHIIFGYYKAIDEIVPDLIWALTNLVPKIFFIWGLNFSHCNEFNFFYSLSKVRMMVTNVKFLWMKMGIGRGKTKPPLKQRIKVMIPTIMNKSTLKIILYPV